MIDTCKVSVNAGALARALKAVIPHADAKAIRPQLNTVRLQALNGALAVIASDSYTLGCYRIPETITDDFDLLLTLKDAKTLEKFSRSSHNIHDVELIVEGYVATMRGFSFEWETRSCFDTIEPMVWQLPIVNNLDAGRSDVPNVTGFDAAMLARFKSAVSSQDDRLVLRHGALNKATIVEAENFVGLIMPRRVDDPGPQWWIPGSTTPRIVDAEVVS